MSISWKPNELCLVAAGVLFALTLSFVVLRQAIITYRHHIFDIRDIQHLENEFRTRTGYLPPQPVIPASVSHTLLTSSASTRDLLANSRRETLQQHGTFRASQSAVINQLLTSLRKPKLSSRLLRLKQLQQEGNGRFVLIPIPTDGEYIGRASGPTLVVGVSWTSRRGYVEFDNRVVFASRNSLPLKSSRALAFYLPKGNYDLEILPLFPGRVDDSLNSAECIKYTAEKVLFEGRVRIGRGKEPRHGWIRTSPAANVYNKSKMRTRYQVCLAGVASTYASGKGFRCVNSTMESYDDLTAHNSYAWVPSTPQTGATFPESLCIAGGSHARNLCSQVRSCKYADSLFVDDPVHADNCTYLLIHKGQWDMGWPSKAYKRNAGMKPLHEYYDSFHAQLFHLLKTWNRWNVGIISTNVNPLGGLINSCPPEDWRNPLVTEAYNRVHEALARKFNILYVDNSDIIMPLWDAARDWCHPEGNVMEALVKATSIRLSEWGWK